MRYGVLSKCGNARPDPGPHVTPALTDPGPLWSKFVAIAPLSDIAMLFRMLLGGRS